ncbi:serine/threonine-protein kinase [Streptomyces sp. WAC06614]|uniref:serine/threonine-protein kinase n=1 Tax=Streptomyces sp. WAC06614 TaxID=2487416 RepID=UPI000F770787|nr:serine/threonine-protein kinase [Streptomyces sp. WAC06614]RSS80297.1 serine/threonine protein kinase [Streptomyces sp. WAC06614]
MDTSEGGRQPVDGRFELISPLGSGGMGTVWRARDIALHREVALKEVRPPDPALAAAHPGLAEQLRERAVREARALARLAHPHVVTIHHIVEPAAGSDGHPWIVMELVKGGSLHDRLVQGPMPVADVVRLGLEVLSALRAAHAEGVLHRDVKPANVLLRPDGSAVLTDFGIAAVHGATNLTATGDLIGSPEYIAPERVRGQEGNPSSDLWSLGMLLYVAAEGVHPLRRASGLATVVAVLDEPIPAPSRSGPLGPVLERLLVRDPAQRPDAAQLEHLLRGAAAALGADGPAAPVPGAPVTPPPVPPPSGQPAAPVALGSFGPAAPIPTVVPLGAPPAGVPAAAATVPVSGAGLVRRRRGPLVALAVAVVLAAGSAAALQWLPGGTGSGGDKGKSTGASHTPGPTSGASGAASPAGSAGTGGGNRGAGTDSGGGMGSGQDSPATPTPAGMISPAGARAAVEAIRKETGTTTFLNLRLYEGYVLADVPVTPGAKATNSYRYDGKVSRFGASGLPVQQGKPPIDMTKVDWDALPGLMDQAQRDLGVGHVTMRYVVVEPWLLDGSPSMRPYLTDETGAGGYVHAGTDGKVVKVYRS